MPTSATRTIPWVIEQQTAVKHQLLRSYIATWMNILWQQQERLRQPPHLIYVDGFAGPGKYWSTEKRDSKVDGSPILVGKVANELMRGQRKLDIIASTQTSALSTTLLRYWRVSTPSNRLGK